MIITLTPAEVVQAALVGVMRQTTNLRDNRKDAHGAGTDAGWELHIQGACGEFAVAKALGLFWSGALGDLRADDVGQLQVRTAAGDGHRLILHESDPSDRVFVLACGRAPKFRLAGWIRGADGKQRQFWTDPGTGRPAYFVPQSYLQRMEELTRRAA